MPTLDIPDHMFSDPKLRSAHLRAVPLARRFAETSRTKLIVPSSSGRTATTAWARRASPPLTGTGARVTQKGIEEEDAIAKAA